VIRKIVRMRTDRLTDPILICEILFALDAIGFVYSI